MYIGQIIRFLGWVTAISFTIAVSSFFLKRINKRWISKLPKKYEKWVKLYRIILKYAIKLHKVSGIVALISVLTHFGVAFSNGYTSITGFISALMIIIMAGLGTYGAFIKKKNDGIWLKVHRIVGFIMIISIASHILTR